MHLPEHDPCRLQRPPAALLPLGAALLCALLTGAPAANAAATTPAPSPATSEPVGYLRATLPAAGSNAPTRRTLGVPFSRPVVFSGTLSSVDATLQCADAAWSDAQFTGTPHYVRLRSGSSAGLSFRISAHTQTALTVDAGGGSLDNLFAAGDAFEIFPAHTLASLFGATAGSLTLGSGTSEATADLVRLNSGSQWLTYFFDGTRWRAPGSDLSQNNTVVPPGQGVFVIHKGPQPVTLTLAGAPRTRTERTVVPPAGDTLLSLPLPAATRVSELGLPSITGWKTGPAASLADTLRLWNGTAWDILYHTGSNWEAVGSFATPNPLLPASSAFLLHRAGDASAPKGTFPPASTP